MDIVDKELDSILDRLARKYVSHGVSRYCCKHIYPVGKEIYSIEEIDELTRNCRVVFINFYSPTCPYCELFHPIYISVGKRYNGKAVFARTNVAYAPELAWRYNVMSTPTTIALVDNEPVLYIPGYVPENVFEYNVRKVLNKAGCN